MLEPCCGDHAITRALAPRTVPTNDLNAACLAHSHLDARDRLSWTSFPPVDWVVTNPPFAAAMPILQHAVAHARVGVALYLRLSFLEPTRARGPWLEAHPRARLAAALVQRRREDGFGHGGVDGVAPRQGDRGHSDPVPRWRRMRREGPRTP